MKRRDVYSPRRYLLLDSCVTAAYYLKVAIGNEKEREKVHQRIATIVNSVRNGVSPDIVLYLPTICIIEVHGVFAKYRFGKRNPQVRNPISAEEYREVSNNFTKDLENGRLFVLSEVSREHVAAGQLINRMAYYIPKKGTNPVSSADRIIIATAIHLAKIHGRDNFAIVSMDGGMEHALAEAAQLMKDSSAIGHLLLKEACESIGVEPRPEVFPNCVDLLTSTDDELRDFFDIWPLPVARPLTRAGTRWYVQHMATLKRLEKEAIASIDNMPYSQEFERIYRTVLSETGLDLSRHEVLHRIMNIRKAGKRAPREPEPLGPDLFERP